MAPSDMFGRLLVCGYQLGGDLADDPSPSDRALSCAEIDLTNLDQIAEHGAISLVSANMPIYYFNIRNDVDTDDEQGKDFADLQAAIAYAIAGARSLAAETVTEGRLIGHHCIEIVDEDGTLLHTVRFDEAVNIQP